MGYRDVGTSWGSPGKSEKKEDTTQGFLETPSFPEFGIFSRPTGPPPPQRTPVTPGLHPPTNPLVVPEDESDHRALFVSVSGQGRRRPTPSPELRALRDGPPSTYV